MAAPSDKTLKDLNGKWVMNKTLSDDYDHLLQMQGVGWFLRRAISFATVTLTISESIDSSNYTHIDIKNVATGGISSTTENRILDWTFRDHKDNIFGAVKGKSRWMKLGDVEEKDKFLKEGWGEDSGSGGMFVQSWVESVGGGWTANQVWGFETVDGERHHTRHVVVRKGDEYKPARLVYDYKGSAKSLEKEEDDDADLAYEE